MCAPNPGGFRKDPLSKQMDRDAMKVGGKSALVRHAHGDTQRKRRPDPAPAASGQLAQGTTLLGA